MPVRKLKPIEERDPYAALVMDAFDRLESGLPMKSDSTVKPAWRTEELPLPVISTEERERQGGSER